MVKNLYREVKGGVGLSELPHCDILVWDKLERMMMMMKRIQDVMKE